MNYQSQNMKIRRWTEALALPFAVVAVSYVYLCLDWLLPVAFLEPDLWMDDNWVDPKAIIAFSTRIVFFLVWLLPLLLGLYAFTAGGTLLFLLHRGTVFEPRVARGLWHMGFALVLNVAATVLAGSVSPLIRSWHNPEGPLPLRFWYSTELGGLLICGLAFMLISAVQTESIRVAKENAEFI